ncbi:MAG: SDR family NAD(P)-dependent oxidoreductase [Hyphomicrobiaceae bacterium]
MIELKGKVALVTGATKMKGLGKAVADRLVAAGATVVVTGRERSMPGAEEVVTALKAAGGEAMAVSVDVAHEDQIDAAVAKIADAHGGIDVLVNNAGIGVGSPSLAENTDRDWDANYAVNVKGTMAMCRGVIPSMIARGGGAIVNVSSMAGLGANPGMPYPYVATKFALVGVTKMLALEFASQGIRANVVAPGAIATDMLMQAYEAIASANNISVGEAARLENASIPLGRPADPGEIADTVVWLASPAAAYVTGVALPVAGGMSPGI